MKLFSAIVAAFSLIIMCSLAQASAVLVDAKGDVKVKQGKREAAAKIGDELADGAVVRVGKGSSASLLSEAGSIDEIGPGKSYTVGKAAEANSTKLGGRIAVAMREMAAKGEGPTVHGMVKEAGGPRPVRIDFDKLGGAGLTALYPSGTAVRLGHVVEFRWSEPIGKGWVRPALALFDRSGQRIALEKLKAGDRSFRGSASKLGLKRGSSYKWFLAVNDGGLRSRTPEYKFSTLSEGDERSLAGDLSKVAKLGFSDDGRALLDAQVYFGHGMYDEAVRTLEPSCAGSPSPFAKKLLHMSYMRMGRISEAKKYE